MKQNTAAVLGRIHLKRVPAAAALADSARGRLAGTDPRAQVARGGLDEELRAARAALDAVRAA